MRKLVLLCFLLLVSLLSFSLTSAFSGDTDNVIENSSIENNTEDKKVETIKELRENINELELEKRQLKIDWQNFLTENGKLQDFLKKDIPEEDEFKLREIIDLYSIYKDRLNTQLEETENKEESDKLKKELLRLKQDLYKKLVYFIEVEKLDDFLNYVKWDLQVNEKRKDVSEEINKDKEKLETKVKVIREKIEENKKAIDERMRVVIEEKLDEKITKILNNETFSKLDNKTKKHLFIITLEKLRNKKNELISIKDKTSLVDQKIEIYNIIETKILQVIDGFEVE